MTAVEYLDYAGKLFQMDKQTRQIRIEAMLARTGLEKAAKRRIGGYSGGMKQRLGIAQALLHEPAVLLLDEPTSALDPAGRYEVLDLIQQLRGHVTVLLSSHILADIERVCDRVAIIHEGNLLLVAERDELLARYATNAILLELVHDSLPLLSAFVTELETQVWVQGVTQDEATLRIMVTDAAVSRQALFPIIARHHLALNRYEWVRPSLEEIFLTISE
jgi:ABC-2 type transport system ATP-binding protein